MTDRFPEAFKRYEEKVETKDMKTFDQLLTSFKIWADKKWIGSRKQVKGVAIESEKKGIQSYLKEAGFRNIKTGKFEKRSGKGITKYERYRSPITGRFMKKPDYLE